MAYREIQDLGIHGYDVDDFEIKDGVVLGSPFEPGDTLVIPDKDNEGNPVIEIKELDPNTMSRGFKAVVIPYTVKKIEKGAFNCCENLAEIHIPASVESIAEDFASSCPSLKKITVDPANKYYDSRNNCNAIICKKNNTLILGCCNTIIPESVEVVGKKAFYGQWNLKFIAIPNSVKKISDCAFYDCKNLTNILIPEGVVEIGENAFNFCTSLVSIYLPDSVKTVATHAFEKCDELVFMRIPSGVEIDKDAFFYVSDRQRLILTDHKMAVKLKNKFPDFTKNAFFCDGKGDDFVKA